MISGGASKAAPIYISQIQVYQVISKDKGAQIPTEETVLQAEDEVMVVTSTENEEAIRAVLMGR